MLGWLKSLFNTSTSPASPAASGRFVEAVDENDGFRPLSQTKRDLPPVTQARMQELAHHAWEQHRIANRLIELPIAFIIGDGAKVTVANPEAQGWLEAWWCDPITRMDLSLEKRLRELALFGEQVIVVFVTGGGHVRHGAIDPSMIDTVIVDPDNAALPIGLKIRGATDGEERRYKIILDGEDTDLLRAPALALRDTMKDGECHFWRINDLLTGRRGRSDLLSAVDIADAYTQMIFGEVERSAALRMAMWDVTLNGATEAQVEERARTIAPPAPMQVRVHNEAETWNAVSPKLESSDASETLRVVRNELLGGATVPEHWYGGGGDVNRATASEMDEPTYKVFRRRQLLWKAILEAEARFVIRSHLAATGRSAKDLPDDMKPSAEFPPMQAIDVARYAQALAQVVAAVASAVSSNLMTEETAVELIATIAGRLGIEIDPATEIEDARNAATAAAEKDAFTMPPDDAAGTDASGIGAAGDQAA